MPKLSEQFKLKESVKEFSDVEKKQPIDSWTKEQFIEYGKFMLKEIKKLALDVRNSNYETSVFASNWLEEGVRILYRHMELGKFSLEDVGTNEKELKEMVAPSSGFSRPLSEEERNEHWKRVFKRS